MKVSIGVHSLLYLLCSSISSAKRVEETTVIRLSSIQNVKSDTEACECLKDRTILKKGEEHLRLLLRVSSVRLVSALQNLAHHANAEIDFLLRRSRWKLFEELSKNFPNLLSQPSVTDSVEELIYKIRNQLFISSDVTPQAIEAQMERSVQNFFVQILPSTILCLTMGSCRSVSRLYTNCLQNNARSWRMFFGGDSYKLKALLQNAIIKYRIIERAIDKLHRLVIEAETVDSSCTAKFTAIAFCGPQCSGTENTGEAIGYCRESCTNAVNECFGQILEEWDDYISILRSYLRNFDQGFSALEEGVIESITYLVEVQSSALAHSVKEKCGKAEFSASSTPANSLKYEKPNITRKFLSLARQFFSYSGWWKKLSANACSDPSQESECWDGSALIPSAEIEAQSQSLKLREGDVSSVKVIDSFEGSGNISQMEWSDDEDLNSDGSGSGEVDDSFDQVGVNKLGGAPTQTVLPYATVRPYDERHSTKMQTVKVEPTATKSASLISHLYLTVISVAIFCFL